MILRWRIRAATSNTGASLRSVSRSSAAALRYHCLQSRSPRSGSSTAVQNAPARWPSARVRNVCVCARAAPKGMLKLQAPCPVDVGDISEHARVTLRGAALLAAATAALLVRFHTQL